MKYPIMLLCLCLSGCFKSLPKHNPQIEETIIVEDNCDYNDEITSENQVQPELTKFYDGLYNEDEISTKIFFAFDSNKLSERDQAILKSEIIEPLVEDNTKHVLIAGHSDWRGQEEYNEKLSKRRADAVADFLQSMGIKMDRIQTFSMGSRYATYGLSKPDSLKDRRCDIVLR